MTTTLTLNADQQRAHDLVMDFAKSHAKLFTIGGYAGTGKTTMMSAVSDSLRDENNDFAIAFCAFTGKAALVLKNKLADTLASQDYCGTIHGLIYQLVGKNKDKMIWQRVESLDYDMIIVDEASMVDETIFKDLRSYGIPILAIGDHGQLPPVSGKFNLMEHPDFKLEQIMRQEENNPIIRLATLARTEGRIPVGEYGPYARKTTDQMVVHDINWRDIDITLCAMNRTRIYLNDFIRRKMGYTSADPVPGESIICLKNNRDAGIFNGNIGTLQKIEATGKLYRISVDMNDFTHSGTADRTQFGNKEIVETFFDNFDWAYCITVHKSQGSEYRSVLLIEERMRMMDDATWRRWLYTAVSRAKEKLLILGRE